MNNKNHAGLEPEGQAKHAVDEVLPPNGLYVPKEDEWVLMRCGGNDGQKKSQKVGANLQRKIDRNSLRNHQCLDCTCLEEKSKFYDERRTMRNKNQKGGKNLKGRPNTRPTKNHPRLDCTSLEKNSRFNDKRRR